MQVCYDLNRYAHFYFKSGAVRVSDEELIAQITHTGISESWARISLRRCNGNVEEAIQFCIESGALEESTNPIPESRSHLHKRKKKGNSILLRTFGGFMSSKQNISTSRNSVDDESAIAQESASPVTEPSRYKVPVSLGEESSDTSLDVPPPYDSDVKQAANEFNDRIPNSHPPPVPAIPRSLSIVATNLPSPPARLARARNTPSYAAVASPKSPNFSHNLDAPPSYDDSTVSSGTSDFPVEEMGMFPGTGSDELLPSYEESHGDKSASSSTGKGLVEDEDVETPAELQTEAESVENAGCGTEVISDDLVEIEVDLDADVAARDCESADDVLTQISTEPVQSPGNAPTGILVDEVNHSEACTPPVLLLLARDEAVDSESDTRGDVVNSSPAISASDKYNDDVVEPGDHSDQIQHVQPKVSSDNDEGESEVASGRISSEAILGHIENDDVTHELDCDHNMIEGGSARVDTVIAAEGAIETELDVSYSTVIEDSQDISVDDIFLLTSQESNVTVEGLTVDDIRLQVSSSFDEASECNKSRSGSIATVASSEDDLSSPSSSRPYSNSTFYLSAPSVSDCDEDEVSSVASSAKLSSSTNTNSRRDLLTTEDSSDSLIQRMEAAARPRGKAAGVAVTVDSAGLITAVSRPQPPTIAALAAVELNRVNSAGSNDLGGGLTRGRLVTSELNSSPLESSASRYRSLASVSTNVDIVDGTRQTTVVSNSLATSPPPSRQVNSVSPTTPPPLISQSIGTPMVAEAEVIFDDDFVDSGPPTRGSGAASAPVMSVAAVDDSELSVASSSRNEVVAASVASLPSSPTSLQLPHRVVTALSGDSMQSGYGLGMAMRPESIARLPQASAVSDDAMDDDTVHGEAYVALAVGSSALQSSSAAVSNLYMRDDRGGIYVAVAAPLQSVDDISSGSGTDHGQATLTDDEEHSERRRGLFSYARHRLYGDEQEGRRYRDVSGGAKRRIFLPFDINEKEGKFVPSVHLRQPKLGPNMGPQHNRPPILNLAPSTSRPLAIRHAEVNTPPLWAGGTDRKECVICYHSAGLLYKIHHCRNCGYYVCNNCSKKDWPASMLPKTYVPEKETTVRVCDSCSYLQEGFVDSLRVGDVNLAMAFFSTGNVNLHSPMSIYRSEEYPIHAASQGGNIHLVRWLLEERKCSLRGADGDVLRTSEGLSPLAIAAYFGHHEIMSYFVRRHGCKVTEIKDFTVLLRGLHAALGVCSQV